MRIPLGVTLESRDGTVSKDAKVVNGIVEARGDQPVLRKRPGTSDLGQVWTTGSAQLLYPWNGLWAIYGDVLFNGTQSTIVSPSFTTWNPSDKGADVTLSGGNLTASYAATVATLVRTSNSSATGKYYWEITVNSVSSTGPRIGIADSSAPLTNYCGFDTHSWSYQSSGVTFHNAVSASYGASYIAGDIIGVALDLDNHTLTFYKNGVSQGQAFSGLSGTLFPAASGTAAGTTGITANFGATAFTYSPPTGFTAGFPTRGTSLGPTTGGLRFDAQEVGASATTQIMMVKNRTQAWTIDKSGIKTAISYPSSMGSATYPVASLVSSGTTATATFVTDPGFNIGDSVTIAGANQAAYNGAQSITAVTAASSTPPTTVPISSLTRSSTTATAVTSTAHGLTNGGTYAISGANETAYNISAAATVVNSTTFTYPVTVTPGTVVTWDAATKTSGVTLSGGNLVATAATGASTNHQSVAGTSSITSGKWYWEITVNSTTGGTDFNDIATFGVSIGGALYGNAFRQPGNLSGKIIGVAWDQDSGIISIYSNNALVATQLTAAGASLPIFELNAANPVNITMAVTVNFGATAFTYTAPAGYQPLGADTPTSPATGSPIVTVPGVSTSATFSYTVAGSPASPATGTITAQRNGGTVPGIAYIDGYFIVMDVNGVMWHSSIDLPGTWGSLNFLTAENENGAGKAISKSQNYLVAFKEWSTEFFYDAKNQTGFAFNPADNGFTQVGCASGDSVAKVDGNLVWLSQVKERGRSVHLMTGLQQQKVSTPDVDRILNADGLSTVYAYGLKIEGHPLYLLTLKDSGITLVYDLSSQSWYQWTSLTLGNSASVTSITRSGTTATVTASSAHGLSDGDPVLLSGANQSEYNAIFQALVTSSTTFQITVNGGPTSPATGTITWTPYTSSYFKFTKYADYQGLNLFLHETNGHLYQMLPTLFQDAGRPIDFMFRTSRLDGGSSGAKVMSLLTFVGDRISDTMAIRHSDDDCSTFSAYRPLTLSLERPALRRLGRFRRRTLEGRHVGNTKTRIEALELEVQ